MPLRAVHLDRAPIGADVVTAVEWAAFTVLAAMVGSLVLLVVAFALEAFTEWRAERRGEIDLADEADQWLRDLRGGD